MDSVSRVKFVIFVVLLLAWSSAGFVFKPGQCPKVTGKTEFEKSRYAGVWYEYQKFHDAVGPGLDCTSYTFRNDIYSMRITKNGTVRADFFGNKFVMRKTSVRALITIPDYSKPSELNMVYAKISTSLDVNYIIQDTDYETYAVVFSCTQVQGLNIQYAYILTRVRGLAPPNLAQLESKLTEAGVDVSAFYVVNQKGCPDV
ncbi:apolipoprotein d-like [Plakobranchus ocellatus]|uniref:Apolipoprotein d-like n=1 Tax=Plakobranchus ocellatus TaxID=259542 RepID=A0AAV4DP55_9GAST|nr:apolipoprotein d-like [Plakobranchus ocellatus]